MRRLLPILLVLLALAAPARPQSLGALGGSRIGPDYEVTFQAVNTAAANFDMSALNKCWAARFHATRAVDIWSVWLNFNSVSSAGQITVRIETDSSGKPSGTLYDANATLAQAPAAGWKQWTFASHPTTTLTPGNDYYIVALTTTGGTDHTLRGGITSLPATRYPSAELTATDGTTRTNLVQVASACPIYTLGMSDGAEETQGAPFTTGTQRTVFGTQTAGAKFVLSTTVKVRGYSILGAQQNGTPTGNLRAQLYNSGNSVVSGSTVTVNLNSLSALASGTYRPCEFPLPGVLTLTAGTYRLQFDQTDHASTSGNNWGIYFVTPRSSAFVPTGFCRSETADITASPPTWTDTTTDLPTVALLVDDIPAASGGGGFVLGGG